MVRELTRNKQEQLKIELKEEFPSLTDAEFEGLNASFDEMVESISAKTQRQRDDVARIVEDKLAYINSKGV